MMLHMLYAREALRGVENGVAFVGQSGGLLGHFQRAADGRGVPLSYVISTGNEAGLETTDFLEFLADDPSTRVIALYCEQIRRPQAIPRRHPPRAAPPASRSWLMQAGRSAKARKSAQSHTGALIGDWATMRTQVEDAGAIVVTTMDEMMDLVEILQRFPDAAHQRPRHPHRVGRLCRPDQRFRRGRRTGLPELEPATLEEVNEALPSYGNYGNPLDTTAGFSPAMLPDVVKALIDDPNVGMLFISFPINTADPGARLQQGHGGLAQAQGDGGAGRHLAAQPRSDGGGEGKPGGVLALVGPHDARDCALHALRPARWPARASAAAGAAQGDAEARQGRAAGMARQENPRRGRHRACRPATSPARRTKPSRSPSASAIRWR